MGENKCKHSWLADPRKAGTQYCRKCFKWTGDKKLTPRVGAIKNFIERNCQGYSGLAGNSRFMGIKLSELTKDELLAIFWYQENENKIRNDMNISSAKTLGFMSGVNHK